MEMYDLQLKFKYIYNLDNINSNNHRALGEPYPSILLPAPTYSKYHSWTGKT